MINKKILKKMLATIAFSQAFTLSGCAYQYVAAPSVTPSEVQEYIDNSNTTENISAHNQDIVQEDIMTEPANGADQKDEISIKSLFDQHQIKAGTCLSPQMIDYPKAAELIVSQFNSVTMENAMKPDYILNRKKSMEADDLIVEFNSDAIKMLDWAKENNMSMRGHTLIWHSQTPDWIFYENFDTSKEFVSRDVMLSRMESYISQVFSYLIDNGYADMFYAYDIVNEAIMEDGTFRDSNWKNIIGDDYIWHAFNFARKYAPDNIDLYLNDYNEQFKAAAVVKFVGSLVDENGNYLLDGIGLQAHMYTQDSLPKYFMAVDKLAGTGLKLQITELDVGLGAWQNVLEANDENLRKQGQFYYDLINGIIERIDAGSISMDSITFWGFADSMSWRKEASPLLYDASLNPKYAFYGVMQDEMVK